MSRENPSWGAPRIHGELLKLGFGTSERTVSRYLAGRLPRAGDAVGNWLAFLRNHREAIAALDFSIVPTVNFHLLYCFFAISRGRRRILHFNVTRRAHHLRHLRFQALLDLPGFDCGDRQHTSGLRGVSLSMALNRDYDTVQ
jgi:hypothetical protein